MTRGKELTVEKRSSILILKKGYSSWQIIAKVNVSQFVVLYMIKNFMNTDTCSSKQQAGPPRKTTKDEDRYIHTLSKTNKCMTASEITHELNWSREDPMGVTTVKKRLLEGTLRGCIAIKKLFLKPQNKVKQLQWANEHANWTISDCERVLWTDESKFEVFGNKLRVFVQQKPNEKLLHQCVILTVKHGGDSVMLWGCFRANKVGSLVKIDGILRKEQYLKILQDHAVPSGTKLIGENFIFMQDNDPKHSAKVCQNYLKQLEDINKLKVIQWPPQSPDLNPIEKL
ncbi:Transposable element Tc1 transposase [Anthophora quadrimaculata]